MSVQKALARKFQRYIAHKADFVELLMSALQGLVREQLRFEALTGTPAGNETHVNVRVRCVPCPINFVAASSRITKCRQSISLPGQLSLTAKN